MEMLEDAKFLGITNFGELKMFQEREQQEGESLEEALKRFRKEIEE